MKSFKIPKMVAEVVHVCSDLQKRSSFTFPLHSRLTNARILDRIAIKLNSIEVNITYYQLSLKVLGHLYNSALKCII
jgi:predicted RNA-binding protein